MAPMDVFPEEALERCDGQSASTLRLASACRNPHNSTPSRPSRTRLSRCIHSCNELPHCCAPLSATCEFPPELELARGEPSCALLTCLIRSPRSCSVCSLRHIHSCRCIDNCTAAFPEACASSAKYEPLPQELRVPRWPSFRVDTANQRACLRARYERAAESGRALSSRCCASWPTPEATIHVSFATWHP